MLQPWMLMLRQHLLGDLSADFVPSWFPATYDLATEVHFFLQDYKKVCKDLD